MLLLDFPDEVIVEILSELAVDTDHRDRLSPLASGHRDIVGFALTCRRALALSEPFLFSAVVLSKGQDLEVFRALGDEHKRTKLIKDIAIIPYNIEESAIFVHLHIFLRLLVPAYLTKLHIELPYEQHIDGDPAFWDRIRSSFGKSTWGSFWHSEWANRLEYCHINFHGHHGQPSEVEDMIEVFDCPRLKKLVLVGVDFSSLGPKDISNTSTRESAVERLSLHACRVPSTACAYLLSLPRALKRVSYFSPEYDHQMNDQDDWPEGWRSLASLCHALTQHKDSLLRLELSIYAMGALRDPEKAAGMEFDLADLTSLEMLTINTHKYNHDLDMKILSSLPKSLRCLKFHEFPHQSDGSAVLAVAEYFLAAEGQSEEETASDIQLTTRTPTLTDLRWRYQRLPRLEEVSVAFWPYCNLSNARNDKSHLFEAIGRQYLEGPRVQLTVYRITRQRNAVPPYLWDELVPSFIKVYDNTVNEDLWDIKSELEKAEAEQARLEAECRRREEEAEARRQERLLLSQIDEGTSGDEVSATVTDVVHFPGWPDNPLPAESELPQPQHVFVPPPPPASMAVIAATVAMANANSAAQGSG